MDVTTCSLSLFGSRASSQKGSTTDSSMQQDQSHSHSKQSDSHSSGKQVKSAGSSKGHSSAARGMGTEHSHPRHGGSGKRNPKDSQKHEVGDETSKPNSRPGSVSPNTQKSAHSRTLDPVKRTAGGGGSGRGVAGERDNIRTTNHSRGSSLTKSLTPNLSPRSTLSASSSSGSLRQEADGSTATPTPASTGGVVSGAEPKIPAEEAEEGKGEMEEGVRVNGVRQESGLSIESESSSGDGSYEQLEAVHLSRSDGHVPQLQQAVASRSRVDPAGLQMPPIVAASGENANPSISSPPGLSKSRSQPLPLSKQSEMVCRQLDLGPGSGGSGNGTKPSPLLAGSDVVVGGPSGRMLTQRLLSRGGGGVEGGEPQGNFGSVEQKATNMVPSSSLNNDGTWNLYAAEHPIEDPPCKGQPPNKGHYSGPLFP